MLSFKQFLVELYNVKKFYGSTSIKSIFKSLKWRQLGEGAFSSVWQPPNANFVVKCWTDDEPYEEYLKYVTKHSDNPHFPKVIGRLKNINAFHQRSHKNEVVKLVKLEKLLPLSEEMQYMLKPILDRYPYYRSDDVDIFPQAATLVETLKELERVREFGEEDLHLKNLMERKDGTVIIVDPWADVDSIDDLWDKQFDDENNPSFFKPHYLEPDAENEKEAA